MKAGYICRLCGKEFNCVAVRERATDEGIENYVYYVGRLCGEHHRKVSHNCMADKLDLKLPITANGIGFPGRKLTTDEIAKLNNGKGEP